MYTFTSYNKLWAVPPNGIIFEINLNLATK